MSHLILTAMSTIFLAVSVGLLVVLTVGIPVPTTLGIIVCVFCCVFLVCDKPCTVGRVIVNGRVVRPGRVVYPGRAIRGKFRRCLGLRPVHYPEPTIHRMAPILPTVARTPTYSGTTIVAPTSVATSTAAIAVSMCIYLCSPPQNAISSFSG